MSAQTEGKEKGIVRGGKRGAGLQMTHKTGGIESFAYIYHGYKTGGGNLAGYFEPIPGDSVGVGTTTGH